jgi:hypothetical protein
MTSAPPPGTAARSAADPARALPRDVLDRRAGILALLLACASAVLSGLLDVLLVPLYAGGSPVPVAVLAAVVGNVVLAVLAARAAGRPGAGLAALACWFVPVVFVSLYLRPEGDVIILAAPSQEYTFYGMLLAGVAAGVGTTVLLSRRASARRHSGSVRYR